MAFHNFQTPPTSRALRHVYQIAGQPPPLEYFFIVRPFRLIPSCTDFGTRGNCRCRLTPCVKLRGEILGESVETKRQLRMEPIDWSLEGAGECVNGNGGELPQDVGPQENGEVVWQPVAIAAVSTKIATQIRNFITCISRADEISILIYFQFGRSRAYLCETRHEFSSFPQNGKTFVESSTTLARIRLSARFFDSPLIENSLNCLLCEKHVPFQVERAYTTRDNWQAGSEGRRFEFNHR